MRLTRWLGIVVLVVALGAPWVYAAGTQTEVTLTLEQQRFTPAEIRVKANTSFTLIIVNKDSEEEEFEIANLRIEKIIPAGKTLRLTMPSLKPGTYEFVGEYHEATAKGRIIAE